MLRLLKQDGGDWIYDPGIDEAVQIPNDMQKFEQLIADLIKLFNERLRGNA